jgi:hypothetical protein
VSEVIDEGLRFVFAGTSIVSDWGNPAATTNRAVMTALIELGHEATYLEPRFDAALVGLLKARGSGAMRAFLAAFPKLQYRTVDLPETFQASSWAGQFLATATAAIALLGCPDVMADGFRQFEDAGVRFLQEEADGSGSVLVEEGNGRTGLHYQAAVLPRVWDEPRGGTLLVAYDDAELARRVAEVVRPDARVVSGMALLPDWDWAPEVELPERYGRAARVVVVDGRDSIAPARVWLARANGATAWGVVEGPIGDRLGDVAVSIGEIGSIDWRAATPVSGEVDARVVAKGLVERSVRRDEVSMNGRLELPEDG